MNKTEPYEVYIGTYRPGWEEIYVWVKDNKPAAKWCGNSIRFNDPKTLLVFKLKFGL
jgi:hypothetical protein